VIPIPESVATQPCVATVPCECNFTIDHPERYEIGAIAARDPIPAKEDTTVTDISPGEQPLRERWAGEQFAYLTTIGRRTGAPHRIEIWFALADGRIYLLSGGRDRSDWVRNLEANPAVTVELGTEKFAGVARVIQPGTPEDRRARELLVSKYRQGNDLDEWGGTSLPVVIAGDGTPRNQS
jgi:deazaflavin-dependent oxidoreductase (nitroreductase family)